MKIIISENQKTNVVEHILKSEGVTYTIELIPESTKYKKNTYIDFLTIKNKVIKIYDFPDITNYIDSLKYVPYDVVNDYFIKKGKEFLEKELPILYPNR